MPIATIALALLGTTIDPTIHSAAAPVCQDDKVRQVDAPSVARPHKLGDEPPAHQIFTVLRSEGGCSRPVPVSDRLVGTPAPR